MTELLCNGELRPVGDLPNAPTVQVQEVDVMSVVKHRFSTVLKKGETTE